MVIVVCALIGVDPGCSLMRRNYLESNFYRYSEKFRFRERCERVLFFYNGKGKFSTEFCDASFLFVCFCTRLKFSAHASVFCFCLLLFFYAKLRNALRQRSRPMKKRRLACACSACHILHTASYDLTYRSIANRVTLINITMETPLMTRRDNCFFMLEFCRFTVSTLGVFHFLWQERNPKKSQTLKILF